jgi:hypothetical protein
LLIGCSSGPDPDFMTPQLRGFKMGVKMDEVKDKIKDAGDYTVKEIGKSGRKLLAWKPVTSRTFDLIEFEFTEKDRLYLTRFYVVDSLRFKSRKVKDDFMSYFNISHEDPGRYRLKGRDIFLYIPNEKTPHLFEFTDAHAGKKWFEVFNVEISASDRKGGPVLKQFLKGKKQGGATEAPKAQNDQAEGSGKEKNPDKAELNENLKNSLNGQQDNKDEESPE